MRSTMSMTRVRHNYSDQHICILHDMTVQMNGSGSESDPCFGQLQLEDLVEAFISSGGQPAVT